MAHRKIQQLGYRIKAEGNEKNKSDFRIKGDP